jgi:hypothetical protein
MKQAPFGARTVCKALPSKISGKGEIVKNEYLEFFPLGLLDAKTVQKPRKFESENIFELNERKNAQTKQTDNS